MCKANILSRSSDGLTLLISSSDGFCSTLSFLPGELGEVYKGDIGPPRATAGTAVSSAQNTPVPTPTSVFAPPSPFPNGSHHRHRDSASSLTAPSPPAASFVSARPSSPTRSNSTSSIITQSSSVPTGVISNPPLISGQVPSLTATNSGQVTGVPITTPPETPRNSATVPVLIPTNLKRDTSEAESEDQSGAQPKRRRIAPMLVSSGTQLENDSAKQDAKQEPKA